MSFDIARMFPSGVVGAEITAPMITDAALHPDEAVALGQVSPKRQRDFTLGRAAAREALRRLGVEPVPILSGADRQPIWPTGICGSITHCEGYGAAVVAFASEIRGIGIDAERSQRLSEDIVEYIALDCEREWLSAADPQFPWEILFFSSKESVFKAWFPLAGTWLDFKHARVKFDPAAREFEATVLTHAPGAQSGIPTTIKGCFDVNDRFVLTTAFMIN